MLAPSGGPQISAASPLATSPRAFRYGDTDTCCSPSRIPPTSTQTFHGALSPWWGDSVGRKRAGMSLGTKGSLLWVHGQHRPPHYTHLCLGKRWWRWVSLFPSLFLTHVVATSSSHGSSSGFGSAGAVCQSCRWAERWWDVIASHTSPRDSVLCSYATLDLSPLSHFMYLFVCKSCQGDVPHMNCGLRSSHQEVQSFVEYRIFAVTGSFVHSNPFTFRLGISHTSVPCNIQSLGWEKLRLRDIK